MHTFLLIVFIWAVGYLLAVAILKKIVEVMKTVFDEETVINWHMEEYTYYWAAASWSVIICLTVFVTTIFITTHFKKK